MLNEDAYKAAYGAAVRLACPFEKAILSRCADCDRAHKFNIAEREAVACDAPAGREHCLALYGLLHQNAIFALKLNRPHAPLPHAKELKIQCGGLLGVQRLGDPEAEVAGSIHALIAEVQARFGEIQSWPCGEVVKAITAYEARRRRG